MGTEKYKTLKELCREIGLKPIPFTPVSENDYNKVVKKFEKRPTYKRPKAPNLYECSSCNWFGSAEKAKQYDYHCPQCNYDLKPLFLVHQRSVS